jgi:hypothetical protein
VQGTQAGLPAVRDPRPVPVQAEDRRLTGGDDCHLNATGQSSVSGSFGNPSNSLPWDRGCFVRNCHIYAIFTY